MRYSNLWRWEGAIGRVRYAIIGVIAFGLKYILDRLVAEFVFGREWSLWNYWISPFGPITPTSVLGMDQGIVTTLLVLALPFIWLGVVLTVRRLRSIGWQTGLVVLFFVPYLNLIFFLLLCTMPPAASEPRADNHRRWLDAILPRNELGAELVAGLLANLLAVPMVLLAAFGLEEYGLGLFVGLPFLLGLFSVLIHGPRRHRTLRRSIVLSNWALFVASVLVLAFALDGLVCIMMALPLAIPLAWLGAVVGHHAQRGSPDPAATFHALPVLFLALPGMLWLEGQVLPQPRLYSVSSAVEVDSPPETVWKHVVAFDELPEPEEWVFRAGIAYPTRAEIHGAGPGAVRHCVFSTGTFVEPIEVWDEPRLLKFSVTSTPAPLKELSPYGELPLPHLDGFFVSKGGQFLLEPLADGGTRLVGTTWYRHGLRPAFYWRWWSDELIHRIHLRVLRHIERLAEADGLSSLPRP